MMKTKSYLHNLHFIRTRLGKVLLSALLLLALHSICLGQISSYTDVSVSGDSVVAYGAILDDYSHGQHINTTVLTLSSPSGASVQSTGGDSTSAYISIDADGYYIANTSHESWCPYTQASFPSGGSSQQTSACVDTCTACRASRHPKEAACALTLAGCEANALSKYNNAMTACDNNNYCNPNHPAYNQQQCDNCKGAANETLLIDQGICGGAYVGCRFLITPNCDETQYKKPNQSGGCDQCNNWPPF
jgi:hypothetical protein